MSLWNILLWKILRWPEGLAADDALHAVDQSSIQMCACFD